MWISRAGASRSISPAWNARSSPQAAAGSSRSRNSARVTKSSNSRVPMPACWAAAAVGNNVIAQRRDSATSRSGAREIAARDSRAGSTPASAFAFSVAWMRSEASICSASASSAVAKPSRCTSRAALQKPSSCPGSEARISGQASRSRISRCSASSSGAASVETAPAPAGRAAPRGSSPSAAERIHRRSWRLHLREVFGQVLAQHAANPARARPGRRSGSGRAAPSAWRSAACPRSPSARRAARTGTRRPGARRPRARGCSRPRPRRTGAASRASSSRAARARNRPVAVRELGRLQAGLLRHGPRR